MGGSGGVRCGTDGASAQHEPAFWPTHSRTRDGAAAAGAELALLCHCRTAGREPLDLDLLGDRPQLGAGSGAAPQAGSAQATPRRHQTLQQHHKRFAKFSRPSTEPCQLPNSCLASLAAGQGGATAVAFSPSGLYLAAACADAGNRFRIVVGARCMEHTETTHSGVGPAGPDAWP